MGEGARLPLEPRGCHGLPSGCLLTHHRSDTAPQENPRTHLQTFWSYTLTDEGTEGERGKEACSRPWPPDAEWGSTPEGARRRGLVASTQSFSFGAQCFNTTLNTAVCARQSQGFLEAYQAPKREQGPHTSSHPFPEAIGRLVWESAPAETSHWVRKPSALPSLLFRYLHFLPEDAIHQREAGW